MPFGTTGGKQQLLERVVVELVGEWPGQARRDSTHDVIGHGCGRNAERGTHLAATELFTKAQPEDISDLAHGDTGLVNCCSSDGLSEEPAEAGPTSRSCYESLLNGCTKTSESVVRIRSERVYGMARNPQSPRTATRVANS